MTPNGIEKMIMEITTMNTKNIFMASIVMIANAIYGTDSMAAEYLDDDVLGEVVARGYESDGENSFLEKFAKTADGSSAISDDNELGRYAIGGSPTNEAELVKSLAHMMIPKGVFAYEDAGTVISIANGSTISIDANNNIKLDITAEIQSMQLARMRIPGQKAFGDIEISDAALSLKGAINVDLASLLTSSLAGEL